MPATPTTKSQVQAYRFMLRRMESALVRKDAVMLHDPMRTQLRSIVVGFFLAALLVAGYLVYGVIKPKESLDADGIVIGKQSGSMYVYLSASEQLVQVENLTSARLLLLQQQQSGGGAAGAAGQTTGPAQPRVVDDSALSERSRRPLTGIPGAPSDLPGTQDDVISPNWSVCDTAALNTALTNADERPDLTTTVLAGLPNPGAALRDGQALLVRARDGGDTYLVYDGKRARVPFGDQPGAAAAKAAFNLGDAGPPRQVTTSLLNAIPEVPPLVPPRVDGQGQPATVTGLQDYKIGDVIRAQQTDGDHYYEILRDGTNEVPQSVADLIRFSSGQNLTIPLVPNDVAGQGTHNPVSFTNFPQGPLHLLRIDQSTVACSTWSYDGNQQHSQVSIADALPIPTGFKPVQLNQADGSGDAVDQVFLPPGKAAPVRSVVPGQAQDPRTGTIWLVTDLGVKFGVPDLTIAGALGFGQLLAPAPENIVGLLPIGPALDPAGLRQFDMIDYRGGVRPSVPPAGAARGGTGAGGTGQGTGGG